MLKKRLGIEAIEIDWHCVYIGTRYEGCIEDYYKIPSTLNIPEGCKKIGMYAFWKCKKLKKVRIPGSVKTIEMNAFDGCENAAVVLGKWGNFEWIGPFAFNDCKDVKEEPEIVENRCEKLIDVIIPDVDFIANEAYWGCEEIKRVIIPESVKEIGDYAFAHCKNLREVVIPESVEKIGKCAFWNCEEATIILRRCKEDFEEIGDRAFEGCKDVKEEVGD